MPVVGLYNISKTFPGVKALDDVTVELEEGEVHSILGENGAGKTTLMNILFGLTKPDTGIIKIFGSQVKINSPAEALKLGIGMVHQHFSLIPTLTVLENFEILSVNKKIDEKEILDLAKRLNLKIDLYSKVGSLSASERQRLEVLRLLYFNFKILIFDEPTSVLTPLETENLLSEIKKMAEEGRSIFFISHKLSEVRKVSDKITVLKKGKVVWEGYNDKVSDEELVRYMIGYIPTATSTSTTSIKGNEVLHVTKLKVKGEKGQYIVNLKNDLIIKENEIVGIAGVAGNGQLELFDAIAGLRKIEDGKILFFGEDISQLPTNKRIKMGIGYIPEDRLSTGVAPDLSVKDNLILKILESYELKGKWGLINRRKVSEIADNLIKEFDIRTPSPDTPVKKLSGGNLQKVILAREISMKPKLLLAYEPTKGLDVGATKYIRSKIYEYSRQHGSVLLYSEDLEELLELSDRLYVIYKGDLVAHFKKEEFNEINIGKAMVGYEVIT